ncbi:MAG: hypothetical protein LBL96_09955 [Clostridiales bacterium]|nr:hypothetical protein [Clostridiales bacterium]
MSLFIIGGLAFIVAAVFIGAALLLSASNGASESTQHTTNKHVDATLYIYDSTINGFDDIKAEQMRAYRDEGVVLRIADTRPAFTQSYTPTYENVRDMQLITRSAGEVKRVNACTVLYLFKNINMINIKSFRLREIYNNLRTSVQNGNTVVLKLDECDTGKFD